MNHASQAASAAEAFHGATEAIAQKHGATLVRGPLKTAQRIADKINIDHKGDVNGIEKKIPDAVRNTIMAPKEQHAAIIADLQKVPGHARFKPQTAETAHGYEGNITNRETPSGILGETQVVTPEMMVAKMEPQTMRKVLGDEAFNAIVHKAGVEPGLGHGLYKKWQQSKKAHDPAAMDRTEQGQQEYYAHFR